jgi:hypothetical protein
MIARFLLVAAVLMLAACGQDKTQEYYMAHPDELARDLADCQQQGKHLYNCNEADKAAMALKKKSGQ